ncbi:MAG: iron-sulfur cluster assembly accessory protein [Gammaproteobacteria bacterium]|nr:iron-sulfur cluster assembly accessory protein [Gammaproteobacteria bacterium]
MIETAVEFKRNISDEDMHLTPEARKQMVELFAQVDDDEIEAVRVFVTGGGCGGMTYGMTFTDHRSENDCVMDTGDVKIYVDAVAMNFMRGVEIDFVERPAGASFIFNNVFAATGGSNSCNSCGSAGGSTAGGSTGGGCG